MNNVSRKKIIEFFTNAHVNFPGEIKGLGWGSLQSQQIRFNILLDGISEKSSKDTILDVGCGYGDLSQYIDWTSHYMGIDLNPLMIQTAVMRYPQLSFKVADISDQKKSYDWILASGVFNIKVMDNQTLLRVGIRNMWDHCKKGIVFNIVVTGSQVKGPDVYFYDPAEILTFCRTLTSSVTCRMGYLPHDATFYLYR